MYERERETGGKGEGRESRGEERELRWQGGERADNGSVFPEPIPYYEFHNDFFLH